MLCIFFCENCHTSWSDDENSFGQKCPECGGKLIKTCYTKEIWDTYGKSDKELLKNTFFQDYNKRQGESANTTPQIVNDFLYIIKTVFISFIGCIPLAFFAKLIDSDLSFVYAFFLMWGVFAVPVILSEIHDLHHDWGDSSILYGAILWYGAFGGNEFFSKIFAGWDGKPFWVQLSMSLIIVYLLLKVIDTYI